MVIEGREMGGIGWSAAGLGAGSAMGAVDREVGAAAGVGAGAARAASSIGLTAEVVVIGSMGAEARTKAAEGYRG